MENCGSSGKDNAGGVLSRLTVHGFDRYEEKSSWRFGSVLERNEASRVFASEEAEAEARKESVKTFVPGEIPAPEVSKEEQPPKKVAPTPEQIIAIKAAILNSQTLEEVARLEQALKSGQLPADLEIIDTDPVTVDTNTNVDKMITESEKEAKDGTSDVNEQKMMGLQTWSRSVPHTTENTRKADEIKVLGWIITRVQTRHKFYMVCRQISNYAASTLLTVLMFFVVRKHCWTDLEDESTQACHIPRALGTALHQFLSNREERIERQKTDYQKQDAQSIADHKLRYTY
nr:PREDICTED: uncharacterized protein LOC108217132 [Daucus carota subsp. sativus]